MIERPADGRLTERRLDEIIAITASVLTIASATLVLAPNLQLVVVSPALDLVVNTVAIVAALAASLLAWIRYQEGRLTGMLFQAAAFLPLAWTNALMLILEISGAGASFGLSLDEPAQAPVYAWSIARFTAATLLLVGGVFALRRARLTRRAETAVVVLPAAIVMVLAIGVVVFGKMMPALVTTNGDQIFPVSVSPPGLETQITPLGAAAQVVIGILFLIGSAVFRLLRRRGGPISDAYVSIGLIVAAFSQLHFAIYPGTFFSLVTTGDVLRITFYSVLLLGVEAEARAGMRALRSANIDLGRLRDAEVAAAALEERARLAREIHDGLAQDLWFAKLKAARLAELPGLDETAQGLADEVVGALDAGLGEARQAVMAMRTDLQGGPFTEILARYVDDFSDRFALRTEFTAEATVPRLSPRAEAELLRIAQEALNNVRKHADATLVRVRIGLDAGQLRLTVSDNGRGFDEAVGRGGYGLQSMQERAALLGGTLIVDSRPSDGTRLAVAVPLDR